MAPMIYSRITARGRIEYYFLVFGGHSILVIEVNYKLGDADERLDAIAQVIAECDGMRLLIRYLIVSHSYTLACDYVNDCAGFHSFPIYAILCDGIAFEFFAFNGKTAQPTFSRGVFWLPNAESIEKLAVGIYGSKTNAEFIFSLRPICETLFYFLLLAYKTGIEASIARGSKDRGSMPVGRVGRRLMSLRGMP